MTRPATVGFRPFDYGRSLPLPHTVRPSILNFALAALLAYATLLAPVACFSAARHPPMAASIAPAEFHGILIAGRRLHVVDGSFTFTGKISYTNTPAAKAIRSCHGAVAAGAKLLAWPAHGTPQIQCTGLAFHGDLLRPASPATGIGFQLSGAKVTFKSLLLWNQPFADGLASFSITPRAVKIPAFSAIWHHANILLRGEYFPAVRSCNFRVTARNLSQSSLFALLSPQHFTASGPVKLRAAVNMDLSGNIVGTMDMQSAGPGTLYVRDIPALEQAMARVYGKGLATVTVLELKAFPYKTEHLRLVTGRHESIITVSLTRGKGNPAHIRPRIITIGGHPFLFKADNMPRIHFTIPLPNISLKRLIQLARGQYRSASKDHPGN